MTSLSTMKRTTHSAVTDDRNDKIEIWINGEFFPRHQAKISVFDSGFLVGDGIWEGIRLHKGKFVFLDRHLDRLFAGAAAIDLEIGLERKELSAALRRTVERNSMTGGVHVRLMVTRATNPHHHSTLQIALAVPTS